MYACIIMIDYKHSIFWYDLTWRVVIDIVYMLMMCECLKTNILNLSMQRKMSNQLHINIYYYM